MSAEPRDKTKKKESVREGGPIQCNGGCGFFGNPATGGMCSVCFKKASASDTKDATTSANTQPSGSPRSTESPAEEKPPSPPKQEDRSRCWSCKRKVGLTGISCKCGYVFCGKHRYPEEHSCTFDFRGMAAVQLERANPVIKGNKGLDRIDSL